VKQKSRNIVEKPCFPKGESRYFTFARVHERKKIIVLTMIKFFLIH
jgi:hypothetical protein